MTELKEMNTMPTEEIMEVAEEIVEKSSIDWAKMGMVGLGAAALAGAGYAAYKYLIKPRLAKKNEEENVIECTAIDAEVVESDSEN